MLSHSVDTLKAFFRIIIVNIHYMQSSVVRKKGGRAFILLMICCKDGFSSDVRVPFRNSMRDFFHVMLHALRRVAVSVRTCSEDLQSPCNCDAVSMRRCSGLHTAMFPQPGIDISYLIFINFRSWGFDLIFVLMRGLHVF